MFWIFDLIFYFRQAALRCEKNPTNLKKYIKFFVKAFRMFSIILETETPLKKINIVYLNKTQ